MKNLKLTKPIALLLSGVMLASTFTVTAAAAAADTHAVGGDLGIVAALPGLCVVGLDGLVGLTAAEDLTLLVQVVDDEQDDIPHLGIAEILLVAVEGREVVDTLFL